MCIGSFSNQSRLVKVGFHVFIMRYSDLQMEIRDSVYRHEQMMFMDGRGCSSSARTVYKYIVCSEVGRGKMLS